MYTEFRWGMQMVKERAEGCYTMVCPTLRIDYCCMATSLQSVVLRGLGTCTTLTKLL
jgi:hypothetical protein